MITKRLWAALAGAALLAACGPSASPSSSVPPIASSGSAGPLTREEQAQVGALVREYLVAHPEVLTEAQAALDAKREGDAYAKFASDPRQVSVGPKNAKVHIVELYDYRCGYCKTALPWVADKLKRGDVRFTFVEYPILSNESVEASQAAIASIKQGKYVQFHRALMASKGTFTAQEIDAIAQSAGIDVARMRRDMQDDGIIALLQDNHDIAGAAKINGTPAFFINGKYMKGGFQADMLDKELKAAANTKS